MEIYLIVQSQNYYNKDNNVTILHAFRSKEDAIKKFKNIKDYDDNKENFESPALVYTEPVSTLMQKKVMEDNGNSSTLYYLVSLILE